MDTIGYCFCNFPDDRWFKNTKRNDYVFTQIRTCGNDRSWFKPFMEMYHKDTPDRVWQVGISSCQNLVIGGGTCLDFKLKEKLTTV